MYRLIIFSVLFYSAYCREDPKVRVVNIDDGPVQGHRYWNGEFYEFYGIPYATAPTGRDRFKPPLPVKPRSELFVSKPETIICQQTFYTGEEEEVIYLNGVEDCLLINILVPEIASEENLVPVVVYIHSGAFAGGSGTMSKLNYVSNRDVIGITFNYRVGALGFACLGTEEIPGNAALKDTLAALKWINKNIKKFGGDPDNVTLAGYSVGATIAELMAMSKQTDGLFNKLILESGSALNPFAINRHPVTTARNIAISMGFNSTGDLKDLNEFYLNAPIIDLATKSLNFFLSNSTFGFAPCIESTKNNPKPFLTESPLDVLKRKDARQLAVLTGFANFEGLSRSSKFSEWSELMNENFVDFLPADLKFDDEKTKQDVAKEIYQYYFKGEEVTYDNVKDYVDYFSDCMFKYAIMKSAKLHAARGTKPVFLYEFSYSGGLSAQHNFMDKITGASHRDQTSYILDFYGYTRKRRDLDTRDRLTWMWTDFAKYENPTAYESLLIDVKWKPYSNDKPYHLSIGSKLQMKKNLLADAFNFWDKIYEKYYWNPTPESFIGYT